MLIDKNNTKKCCYSIKTALYSFQCLYLCFVLTNSLKLTMKQPETLCLLNYTKSSWNYKRQCESEVPSVSCSHLNIKGSRKNPSNYLPGILRIICCPSKEKERFNISSSHNTSISSCLPLDLHTLERFGFKLPNSWRKLLWKRFIEGNIWERFISFISGTVSVKYMY